MLPVSDAAWAEASRRLTAFLRSRGLSEADASDVLHDALLRVLRADLRDPGALDAYVFRTVRRVLADRARRGGREVPGFEGEVEAPAGPTEAGAASALASWLRGAIDALPEPTRSTLRATELEGRPHRALAEAEGVSVSAIKSRVSRGRAKLRAALEACCEVELDVRRRVVAATPRGTCTCG